jgi:hypothetical protein
VHWGSKILGVRAKLPVARKATVLNLVRQAYAFKAEQVSTGGRRAKSAQRARKSGDA